MACGCNAPDEVYDANGWKRWCGVCGPPEWEEYPNDHKPISVVWWVVLALLIEMAVFALVLDWPDGAG